MSSPEPHTPAQSTPAFDQLLAEVMTNAGRFGHREHIHLTWLAVRRYGIPVAIDLIGAGIQRTARYAGSPQKYNATVSRAWVELVGHHADPRADDFAAFIDGNPALLDKRLLTRFYRSRTLATPTAKQRWVEPDRRPLPDRNG